MALTPTILPYMTWAGLGALVILAWGLLTGLTWLEKHLSPHRAPASPSADTLAWALRAPAFPVVPAPRRPR